MPQPAATPIRPLPLATAEPCGGCGACCTVVGVPPGYAAGFPPENDAPFGWFADSDDGRRLAAMPAELRRTLADHYAAVDRGETADRSLVGRPCLWFDATTRRCRHYDWRPEVCRTFRAGSAACQAHRQAAGLPSLT